MIEVEQWDFVAVPTQDVAKRFYGETLGLEKEKDSPARRQKKIFFFFFFFFFSDHGRSLPAAWRPLISAARFRSSASSSFPTSWPPARQGSAAARSSCSPRHEDALIGSTAPEPTWCCWTTFERTVSARWTSWSRPDPRTWPNGYRRRAEGTLPAVLGELLLHRHQRGRRAPREPSPRHRLADAHSTTRAGHGDVPTFDGMGLAVLAGDVLAGAPSPCRGPASCTDSTSQASTAGGGAASASIAQMSSRMSTLTATARRRACARSRANHIYLHLNLDVLDEAEHGRSKDSMHTGEHQGDVPQTLCEQMSHCTTGRRPRGAGAADRDGGATASGRHRAGQVSSRQHVAPSLRPVRSPSTGPPRVRSMSRWPVTSVKSTSCSTSASSRRRGSGPRSARPGHRGGDAADPLAASHT